MYNQIPGDIPQYVRVTIYAQICRLLKYSCFSLNEDREDLIQELLLFYLELIQKTKFTKKMYVVKSIQHYASDLLKFRTRKHLDNFLSIEDVELNKMPISRINIEEFDVQKILKYIVKNLSEKECRLVHLYINENYSLNKICRLEHVSKSTVFNAIEKIKKSFKK